MKKISLPSTKLDTDYICETSEGGSLSLNYI